MRRTFLQQNSLLIGAQSDIDTLAEKETARLLVLSDSHGSADTVLAILDYFGGSADALCFCGDGMADLALALSKAETDEGFAAHIPPVVAFVRGNGDWGTEAVYGKKNAAHEISVPRTQLLVAARQRIFITHGHNYDVYYSSKMLCEAARKEEAGIALFGHTHIANVQQKDGLTLINPGSCARPRGGQPPTFAIVTITAGAAAVDFSYFRLEKPYNEAASDTMFRPFQPYNGNIEELLW